MGDGAETASDYIVVGAGSAGSVITRRLLDAGHSVHVIEAGLADSDPAIHSPQGWPGLLGGRQDWGVVTTPQRHACDRRLFWPRGKVLDEYHGAYGPLPISTITTPHPLSAAFVDAANIHGHKVIDDFNAGDMIGVGYNHTTTRGGERMSAWKSFVAPMLDHPNLTLSTGALVHRVVLSGGRAVGVEYSQDGEAPRRVRADAEVVLSAGVLGSPKALLLSGIGPSHHLTSVGVTTMVDLPGVGENLHDHLLLSNVYAAQGPLPAGANNLLEAQLFTHSRHSEGPAPDLQPVFIHIPYPAEGYPTPKHGYTIAAGLVAPKSRGTLRLASAHPTELPLVDPNILAEPYDLDTLIEAVEICRGIGASQAFAPWREAEVAPGPRATTRADLREFVRRSVGTYHHQVGTCQMGPSSFPDAVVGPDLRVHGVDGLRVADASIMPTVPAGNTNAPSMMIGERAADLLLGIEEQRKDTSS